MLEVHDLVVRYGRTTAVSGISFTVAPAEIVAIVGANGAGKSSTLAAITGLVPAAGGVVRYDGHSLLKMPPERIVRYGIALVPEGREIFASLTVAENMHLGSLAARDRDRRSVEATIEQVLEHFPVLRRYYKSSAGTLSGGEQQQLAIARALLARPSILLLDEPSLGLAPQVVDLVFDVIAQLRDDGVAVLVVEQNAMRAIELADRSYFMQLGKIADSGTREDLTDRTDLVSMYLGTGQDSRTPGREKT